jgi:hypothetical protein
MLHVVYRSYGPENGKPRPIFYSKVIALVSLVRAVAEVGNAAEMIFLNNGPIPAEPLHVMERSGEVVALSGLSLKESMRTALALPIKRGWSRDDLVWFAEDDYLYLPSAIASLAEAAITFPEASYFGLYASIGHRPPEGGTQPDYVPMPRAWRDSQPVLVSGHPWRRALSTTSTFGARIGALEEDRQLMRAAMWSGGAWDYTTCLIYQGFQPYPLASMAPLLRQSAGVRDWARRAAICVARAGLDVYQVVRARAGSPRRLLVAPDPALATHLATGHMSLGTDWSRVAEDTALWGEETGLI